MGNHRKMWGNSGIYNIYIYIYWLVVFRPTPLEMMEWKSVGMMTFPTYIYIYIYLWKNETCSKPPTRIWCHAEIKHINITWMVGDTPYKVLGKVTNGSIRCYDIPMTYQIPILKKIWKNGISTYFEPIRWHQIQPRDIVIIKQSDLHRWHRMDLQKSASRVSDSSERGEVFLDFCDQFYHQHVNGNSRILKWRYCTI